MPPQACLPVVCVDDWYFFQHGLFFGLNQLHMGDYQPEKEQDKTAVNNGTSGQTDTSQYRVDRPTLHQGSVDHAYSFDLGSLFRVCAVKV